MACPKTTWQTIDLGTLEAKGGKVTHLKLADVAEFGVATGAKRYAYREGELRQRQNLDCLGERELERLRQAFRTIYDLDDRAEDRRNFNNQALIHQNHCQHGWERFLPWHRAYLYEFEQNLQDFDRDIMLPYWDWTMPKYRPDDPTNGCIIPPAFKAFLRPDAVDAMIGDARSETQQGAGRRVPRHGGRTRRADAVRLAARVLLLRDRHGRLHGGHARSGEGEQEPRRR